MCSTRSALWNTSVTSSGDQQDRQTLRRQIAHDAEDARPRADIDAHGRTVQDQQPRLGRQPFRQHDLLLVAPQRRDGVFRRPHPDAQRLDPAFDQPGLGRVRDQPETVQQPVQNRTAALSAMDCFCSSPRCSRSSRHRPCPARWPRGSRPGHRAGRKPHLALHRARHAHHRMASSVRPAPRRPIRPTTSPRRTVRSISSNWPGSVRPRASKTVGGAHVAGGDLVGQDMPVINFAQPGLRHARGRIDADQLAVAHHGDAAGDIQHLASRWLTKTMATPSADRRRTISSRRSVSIGQQAVGSSMKISRASFIRARAMATTRHCAMGSVSPRVKIQRDAQPRQHGGGARLMPR